MPAIHGHYLHDGGHRIFRAGCDPGGDDGCNRPSGAGISQAMMFHSLSVTPKAMLSRGIAGICGHTLIINLPGSPKAVRENLEYILEPLKHGLEILKGEAGECGGSIR